MNIYDINFLQLQTEILPPSKRTVNTTAYLKLFGDYYQFLHSIVFTDYYLGGGGYLKFDTTFAGYADGDRVRGNDNKIYELIDATKKITALGLYANPKDNLEAWTEITVDYRGVFARSRYNSQKLVLEFVLNEYFETEFRQPDDDTTPTPSDIYIVDAPDPHPYFIVQDSQASSPVINSPTYTNNFVTDSAAFLTSYWRTIYVPESGSSPIPGWWTAFNAYSDGERKIRAVVDLYNLAGVNYQILTY